MNTFLLVVGVLTVALASLLAWLRYLRLRRSGILPERGRATLADVGRLVAAGERAYAVGCYRRIQNCSLAEAKKAVDKLYPAV